MLLQGRYDKIICEINKKGGLIEEFAEARALLLLLIVIILVVAMSDIGGMEERCHTPSFYRKFERENYSLNGTDGVIVGLREGSSIPVESFPQKYDFESYAPIALYLREMSG